MANEATTTEFESDYFEHVGAVLPCQVRSVSRAMHARSGERLLMLALLADAINIFLKGATERRLMAETRNWILGRGDDRQAVSFEDACSALDIDPDALRERLFRIKYRTAGGEPVERRRASLMLKPPAMTRGPVKVAESPARRTRRRATS
jgi:hypothetical protein